MAGRPSKLKDPDIVEFVVKNRALGFGFRRIADALELPESTVRNWAHRKDIRRLIAERQMLTAEGAVIKVLQGQPLQWLERVMKEEFAPPSQKQELDATVNFTFSGWLPTEKKDQKKLAHKEPRLITKEKK